MSEFVKLSQIADLTVGFVGTMAKHYTDTGVPFLRSLNIKPFKIVADDMKYISPEFSEIISKSILHENDIVIVRTGIPGTCSVVSKEYDGCNCSDVVIMHPNLNLVDPNYLAAYINVWGQRQISNNKVGAIQQHFNVHSAEEMLIYLPDISIQHCVAEVITTLNKKIETNEAIGQELESMAKTLYDYWFVQFDFPDANGKPYQASGGEMVWNEQLKREIPKGWEVDNLYRIADFANGLACQKHRPDEGETGLPVIKIKEMHEGITDDTERVSANIPEKNKIYDGDVLFSWSATLEVMYWFGGEGGLNQHIFKVTPKKSFTKEYMYEQLSAYVINFVKMAEARKTTMGHITTDHLEQSRIVIPPDELVLQFTSIVKPLHEKIGQAQRENRELRELRDWLLPMLMNGQATVAPAEAAPKLQFSGLKSLPAIRALSAGCKRRA